MNTHPAANIFPLMLPDEFEALKADIAKHGQREAIWTWRGFILDGRHRSRACEELGRAVLAQEFEGTEADLLPFVISLNLQRRHLDESQRAMVAAGLATLSDGQRADYSRSADLPTLSQSEAAAMLNVSERLLRDAKAIERDAPELVEKVRTGELSVTQAQRMVRGERIRRKVSLPTAKYRVILADPPWAYGNTQPDYHGEQRDHFPVMPLADICALRVIDIIEDNAALFLWATSPILEESFQVVKAWGFEYKASYMWDKVKHNMGHYNSVRHEFLLVCTRGSCMPDTPKLFDSVVTQERGAHSVKPEVFYDIIETQYPVGKRIELFARSERAGWDGYGYEARWAA